MIKRLENVSTSSVIYGFINEYNCEYFVLCFRLTDCTSAFSISSTNWQGSRFYEMLIQYHNKIVEINIHENELNIVTTCLISGMIL